MFDNVPAVDKETTQRISNESARVFFNMVLMSKPPQWSGSFFQYVKGSLHYLYKRFSEGSTREAYLRLEKKAKSMPWTGNVGTVMFMVAHCRPLRVYENIIKMPFETFMMPVPSGYDELLEIRYGDYMTPVMGATGHNLLFFDVNRSYKEVLKDIKVKQ